MEKIRSFLDPRRAQAVGNPKDGFILHSNRRNAIIIKDFPDNVVSGRGTED